MTKNFCDLCGEPAKESPPTLRVEFPNMVWRGAKFELGHISSTDGTWVPFVEARIVFEAKDMPSNHYAFHPDLCCKCIANLLHNMADSIK